MEATGESFLRGRASYRGVGCAAGSSIVERTHVMVWAVVGIVAAVLVCACTVSVLRKRGRARG
jgi:hypothetical protein